MNIPTHQTLNTLFIQGKYQEIIDLTALAPEINQANILIHYYRGLSLFRAKEPILGAVTLASTFTLLNQPETFTTPETPQIIAHIADTIITFAHLLPDYEHESIRSQFINIASTILESLGKKLNNIDYIDKAQKSRANFISTCYQGYPGIIYRSNSPYSLQIEPTNTCNLKCSMCPRTIMTRKQGFLTIETLKTALESWSGRKKSILIPNIISNQPTPITLSLPGVIKLFFMGEPLIHPNIEKLIETCNSFGCMVGIQTNGTLFSDPKLRTKIINAKPHSINFSIDGINQESYENIRRGSDSDKLFSSIQLLHQKRRELGLEKEIFLTISSIITNNSETEKRKTMEFLKYLEPFVDHINFINLEKKHSLEFINENGSIIQFTADHMSSTRKPLVCSESLEKLNILWDGTITPCCNDINGILKLGEVSEGIDTVWNSPKTRKLQNQLLNNDMSGLDLCAKCLNRI